MDDTPFYRKEPWRTLLLALLSALAAILGGSASIRLLPPCCPTPPCQPPPDADVPHTPNPYLATVKVLLPSGYCSGTVIRHPTRNQYFVISAAHCFKRIGDRITIAHRNGQTFPSSVLAIDRTSDAALLSLPQDTKTDYAQLAENLPPVGSPVHHFGYGIDIPGNREDGTVAAPPDTSGQVRYRLNVSPGDSGAGIFSSDTQLLLSPVCCTTRIGRIADVWGASPQSLARLLASPLQYSDLPPITLPIRE